MADEPVTEAVKEAPDPAERKTKMFKQGPAEAAKTLQNETADLQRSAGSIATSRAKPTIIHPPNKPRG